MTDLIAVSRDGPIATVVLNRPEKLNALTKAMWRALGVAIDALSATTRCGASILRGADEKAFSPGNDIAEFATERSNKAQAIAYGRVMHATARSLARAVIRSSRRSTASAWAADSTRRALRSANCGNRADSERRSRTSGS